MQLHENRGWRIKPCMAHYSGINLVTLICMHGALMDHFDIGSNIPLQWWPIQGRSYRSLWVLFNNVPPPSAQGALYSPLQKLGSSLGPSHGMGGDPSTPLVGLGKHCLALGN